MNPAVAAATRPRGDRRRAAPARERAAAPGAGGCELSFALVTALTNRLRDYLTALTEEVWRLERQVTGGHLGDPEQFLEELFQVRHGLLAVRTMAALGREVYGRMAALAVFGPGAGRSAARPTWRTSSGGSPRWPTASASTCRA